MDSARCYRCARDRPSSAFVASVDDRHFGMCRSCVSEVLSSRGRGKERLKHTKTERTCYLCRRILPTPAFTRRANGTYFSACKDCNRAVFATRRRARRLAAGGSYTRREWEDLLAQYERCPSCLRVWEKIPLPPSMKSVITADHIVPIARGGSSNIGNIQPMCYSCNSRKGAT